MKIALRNLLMRLNRKKTAFEVEEELQFHIEMLECKYAQRRDCIRYCNRIGASSNKDEAEKPPSKFLENRGTSTSVCSIHHSNIPLLRSTCATSAVASRRTRL